MIGGSLIVLIGGWGWAWGDVQSTITTHGNQINTLDKRTTRLETASRQFDNHELRIANLEQQSGNTAATLKALEGTLNDLSSDMKVTREILQRLERRSQLPP